jgi:ubiquinone/menaquinone biosynthesis C-methylase UbiE
MKSVVIPEMLDSDAGTVSEVRTALVDLRRINRWLGGTSTTMGMLAAVIKRTRKHDLSILEVGSGATDLPLIASNWGRKRGLRIRVTCFDRCLSHLAKGAPAVVGDARQLPFANESFDLVSCCLFAHHLEPAEIVQFAREALRVARVALLVNDLMRSPVHWAMAWVGRPIWRSRLTRHDSVVSVRRSYTQDELRAVLNHAQPAQVEITEYYFFRMGAIAWKDSTAPILVWSRGRGVANSR